MGCLCLGGGGGDAVDKQRAEAEKLKEKDRARINREIEKGNKWTCNFNLYTEDQL